MAPHSTLLLGAATRTACVCCYRVGNGRADHPATALPPVEVNAVDNWGSTPMDWAYFERRIAKCTAKENPKLKQKIKNKPRGCSHAAQLVKKFGGKSGFQLRKLEEVEERSTDQAQTRKVHFRKTATEPSQQRTGRRRLMRGPGSSGGAPCPAAAAGTTERKGVAAVPREEYVMEATNRRDEMIKYIFYNYFECICERLLHLV